jgi:Tat protein translocase TatB subunit
MKTGDDGRDRGEGIRAAVAADRRNDDRRRGKEGEDVVERRARRAARQHAARVPWRVGTDADAHAMFDIGFSEIVVIAVVALVVLGPEKLPKTARTLGHLFGRLQRYVNDVKRDIQRELELDELRKLQQNVQSAAKEIETSMTAATRDVEQTCATSRRR